MSPDEKTIEELKVKVAPRGLHQIDVEGCGDEPYTLVVSAPTRAEWLKYLNDVTATDDVNLKGKGAENFVLAVTHWPEREEVKAFFAQYFAAVGEVATKLSNIVGSGATARSKKL